MRKPVPVVLPEGTELAGYVIGRVLGSGGFGVTYYGSKLVFPDDHVAIKEFFPAGGAMRRPGELAIVPTDIEDFEIAVAGLEKEARTLKELRHPNVAEVQHFFRANGTAYLVMKYEKGTSLGDRLKRGGALDESTLLRLLPPLLDGLEAVHEKGYLHRDIKPDNIYLREPDGVPVLLDFGAARRAIGKDRASRLTEILTPGFAPPEQYVGSAEQGPFTDIYALGATLYRCMTERSVPDSREREWAIRYQRPDPLTPTREAARRSYSDRLHDCVGRSLALDPHRRPQSVAEFRALLGLELTTQASKPPSTSVSDTTEGGGGRPQPPFGAMVRIAVIGIVVAAAAATAYLVARPRPQDAPRQTTQPDAPKPRAPLQTDIKPAPAKSPEPASAVREAQSRARVAQIRAQEVKAQAESARQQAKSFAERGRGAAARARSGENGHLVLVTERGTRFEGEVDAAIRDIAYGVFHHPNRDRYEGAFRRGNRHYYGIYVAANGVRIEGAWGDDAQPTVAAEFGNDGRLRYAGEWNARRYHGVGIRYWPGPGADQGSYEGQMDDGRPHGVGVFIFNDGRLYEGEVADGKLSGRGVMTSATGQLQAGRWADDKFLGPE